MFQRFEPVWSVRFPSAMTHLAVAGRARSELPERDLRIVTLQPKAYDEFLEHNRRDDSMSERQRWAEAYIKSYRLMETRP